MAKMDHGRVEAAISHATKKERYLKISRFYHSFASSEEVKGKQIAAVAAATRKLLLCCYSVLLKKNRRPYYYDQANLE